VWVLDPEALTVRREIPIDGVQFVAGWPGSTVGFALSVTPLNGPSIGGPRVTTLTMVNFGTGKLLHELKSSYPGESQRQQFPLLVNNEQVLDMMYPHMGLVQSPDGRFLYTAAQKFVRFRVEGENLIYEACSRPLVTSGSPRQLAVSNDGNWIALPGGAGNSSQYGIDVYPTDDFYKPRLTLTNGAYPTAVGFDTKTGIIYSPNHMKLQVFSSNGGKIEEFDKPQMEVLRIIVHPAGERFVVWGTNIISVFVLDPQPKAE
jgi:hypothetical protein